MANRIVYCYPDEIVEIRVIRDDELPKNAAEWNSQVNAPKTVFAIRKEGEIHFFDPDPRKHNQVPMKLQDI